MLGGSSPYQNPTMCLNGKVEPQTGYMADLITEHALHFLDQQGPDKPFFLTVSHFNPHTPYEGHPQKYYDMYAKTAFDTWGGSRRTERAARKVVPERHRRQHPALCRGRNGPRRPDPASAEETRRARGTR